MLVSKFMLFYISTFLTVNTCTKVKILYKLLPWLFKSLICKRLVLQCDLVYFIISVALKLTVYLNLCKG